MLRLFVIFICCAVVFEDSHGIMSPTSSPTSSPKSSAASNPTSSPKSSAASNQSNSTILSVHSLTSEHASQTTSVVKSSHSSMRSIVSSTIKPSTATTKSTISPNSTISPKPIVTSTAKSTTTPKPTAPPPPYGNFSLHGENGTFCLLAEFVATISIQYETTLNNTKTRMVVEHLNRTTSDHVNVTGDCGVDNSSSRLVLSWPKKKPLYKLAMMFERLVAVSEKSNKTTWEMRKITFNATIKGNDAFRNFSGNATYRYVISSYNSSKDFGKQELGSYFMCDAARTMKLENDLGDKFKVDSSFSDLKLEPFAHSKDGSFNGPHIDCKEDKPKTPPPPTSKPNNIVPIAVGCALAGLVLIVLIAYVIGRRKSHSGYEKGPSFSHRSE